MTVSSRFEDSNTLGSVDVERALEKNKGARAMLERVEIQKLALPASVNMHESGIDDPGHKQKVTPPANKQPITVQTECWVSRYSLIRQWLRAYPA